MALAKAVCRPDGPVLVGEGVVLTDVVIERIRLAGVGSIWVDGDPLDAEGGVGDLRAIAAGLPFLFRRHKSNVFMMTLCNVLTKRFAGMLAEQQALEKAAAERALEAAAARRRNTEETCAGGGA